MTSVREIFTVGHSTHSIETFIELLKRHGIEGLADVRRWPTSKKFPHFSRETLSEKLQAAGIEYEWLGEELGGYRTGGYEPYTSSTEFKRGLDKLIALAGRRRVAIMCAEGLFFKCHRRFISDSLVKQGWRVWHIFPDGRLSEHRQRDLLVAESGPPG